MQAHRLGAAMGWTWIREGFALFRRQPFSMMSLVLAFTVIMSLALFSVVGAWFMPIVLPGLSCSFMYACRAVEQGQFARPGFLIAAFREPTPRTRSQFKLGGLYLATIMIGSTISSVIALALSDGHLEKTIQSVMTDPNLTEFPHELYPLLILSLVQTIIVTLAFWFAPVLIAWHGLTVRKALFFSGVAVLRALPALLVFMVLAIALLACVGRVMAVLFDLISLDDTIRSLIMVPGLAIPTAVLMCAIYCSYRHAFGIDPNRTVPPEA